MKIAVWHNLPSGGGKRALHDHVSGLAARDHQIEIWCPDTADIDYLPLSKFGPEHVLPIGWVPGDILKGTIAKRRPANRESSRKIAIMNAHCRQVAEEIGRGRFDLLFANSCKLMGSAPIARYVSIPTVLYLQEPNRPLYEARPEQPWALPSPSASPPLSKIGIRTFIEDYIRIWNMRQMVREEVANAAAFDSILVNSYFSRESVRSAYGLNSSVCYLGVDYAHFAAIEQPRENYVVGLGSYLYQKGVHSAIEALGHVPEPRPRLVWIGNMVEQEYFKEVTALAKKRGVVFEPKVMINDAELLSLLHGALAMVCAPVLEPFGFAPLEGNACGTPVVAVAEGGLRETVEDGVNGLVVAPQPEAMAAAIVRLRDDPALATRLGEQGRQNVQTKWSVSSAIDRLEARFNETIAKAAAGLPSHDAPHGLP